MTSSKFYMLAQHYKRYVLPLLLVFISEIVLVLYLITNIVSSRETFDIWTQMILLALPLFFFLLIIVPAIRIILSASAGSQEEGSILRHNSSRKS